MKKKDPQVSVIYLAVAAILGGGTAGLILFRTWRQDKIEANHKLDVAATNFAKELMLRQVARGAYKHLDKDQIEKDFAFYKMMYRNGMIS